MPFDAVQLGYDGTVEVLRNLLAEQFDTPINANGAVFAIEGLSSLEGIEFLCAVEKQFDLQISDLEWWVYETPTLGDVAHHLIDLSKKQHAVQEEGCRPQP